MFSRHLIRAREQQQLSKLQLAAESGVSYKHIANLEADKRPITLDILHKLDKRLHFDTRVLVEAIRAPRCTAPRRRRP